MSDSIGAIIVSTKEKSTVYMRLAILTYLDNEDEGNCGTSYIVFCFLYLYSS